MGESEPGRQTMRIFGGTWNVNGKRPSMPMTDFLFGRGSAPGPEHMVCDVYLVGLQEAQPLSGMNAVATDMSRGRAWKDALDNEFVKLNEPIVCVSWHQMVGICLLVYAKQAIRGLIQNVHKSEVGTGFLNMAGNKGGIAMRFDLAGHSVAAVACHLAASQSNVDKRNQDFRDVVRRAVFEERYSILSHEVVFWLGDLNYRIDLPVPEVMKLIAMQDWETLRKYDQLIQAKSKGDVLQGFQEAVISFAPTYKLSAMDSTYEMDEEGGIKRTPSWTDRVLWRTSANMRGTLRVCAYRRHEVLGSDHRPVSAVFDCMLSDAPPPEAASTPLEAAPSSVAHADSYSRALVADRSRQRELERMVKAEVHVDPQTISAGTIAVGVQKRLSFNMRNTGSIVAHVEIHGSHIGHWLLVDDRARDNSIECALAPGESMSVDVHILLDSRASPDSAAFVENVILRKEPLEGILRVVIRDGGEKFVVISADLVPTALGLSLNTLACLSIPVAECATQPVNQQPAYLLAQAKVHVPLEIFMLLDLLYRSLVLYKERKGGKANKFVMRVVGAHADFSHAQFCSEFDRKVEYLLDGVVNQRKRLDCSQVDLYGADQRAIDPFAIWCCLLTVLRNAREGVLSPDLGRKMFALLDTHFSSEGSTSLRRALANHEAALNRGTTDGMVVAVSAAPDQAAENKLAWLRETLWSMAAKAPRIQFNTFTYVVGFLGVIQTESCGLLTAAESIWQQTLNGVGSALFSHSTDQKKDEYRDKLILALRIMLTGGGSTNCRSRALRIRLSDPTPAN
ncbi:Type II inositol 1,4,5-trisphosphate 5-phosphatase [Porphyridium purpureum]|uniref:Type II inositol 1,4,5-trisphosphate 5-phosphatase n=1 Tax=Porphyridium purpureum TaxID=35688 RepID=A0A5J4YWJ4_PORPP|nr:Type II inositol 1,4,5-trisphosphate 5-phosphatase [Porphyridium purpureum]|eukprot:POR8550..scf209_3